MFDALGVEKAERFDGVSCTYRIRYYCNVAQCLISLSAECDDEIRRGSPRSGAQTGVGWFSIDLASRDAIFRKQWEIELR